MARACAGAVGLRRWRAWAFDAVEGHVSNDLEVDMSIVLRALPAGAALRSVLCLTGSLCLLGPAAANAPPHAPPSSPASASASASPSAVVAGPRSRLTDPLQPLAVVPAVSIPRPLAGYRAWDPESREAWGPANDRVRRIGGWRSYAREAAQPGPEEARP